MRSARLSKALDAVPAIGGGAAMQALATLTPPLRHVFVLRVIEGYSHAEIAGLLEISTNTSEVRLHRAVHQLRRLLEAFV